MLNTVQERFEVNISELPDEIESSSYSEFQLLLCLVLERAVHLAAVCYVSSIPTLKYARCVLVTLPAPAWLCLPVAVEQM